MYTSKENKLSKEFPSLLPISMKIFSQTISTNLVPVMPIGGGNTYDEIKDIKEEVKIENSNRKIESVVEGKEFEEMKLEDHPDYIKPKGPSGELLSSYLYMFWSGKIKFVSL